MTISLRINVAFGCELPTVQYNILANKQSELTIFYMVGTWKKYCSLTYREVTDSTFEGVSDNIEVFVNQRCSSILPVKVDVNIRDKQIPVCTISPQI